MLQPLPDAGEGRAIRLLWLIDSLAAGGAEALAARFALAVARPGRAGGAELEVAYLKSLGGNPYEAEIRAAGVPVTDLGARNLRDIAAFRRLLGLLRRGRFDLVHAHLGYASIWGLLAGRLTGRPVAATFHVQPPAAPPWSREGFRRRLLVAAANRWAGRVLAVSGAARDAWTAAGLAPDRVRVVVNGVDLPAGHAGGSDGRERRAAREELGLAEDTPLAMTVSVLRPGKGLEVLLEAIAAVLAALPRARFAVVGDGPDRAALEARAQGAGLAQAVLWTGFRRDVPELLPAADLFVLPSLEDAFPTVLLEAMAAGLPVVSTRTGGIPEIVDDGATGLLVPPGDAAALAGALSALLADPAARRELGVAGRRRAEERFTTAAWLERLELVYGDLLGRPVRLRSAADLAIRRPEPIPEEAGR